MQLKDITATLDKYLTYFTHLKFYTLGKFELFKTLIICLKNKKNKTEIILDINTQ